MNRNTQVIFTLIAVFGAFLATGEVAAANQTEDYRTAMRDFLPVIVDWSAEFQQAAHAAAVKPDPERLAQVAELGKRGGYILDDVRGTGVLAPRALKPAHSMLADFIGTLNTAAEMAQTDPVAASEMIDGQIEWVQPALGQIQNFLTRIGIGRPGATTEMPGSGN